jgi:hypothetical protein
MLAVSDFRHKSSTTTITSVFGEQGHSAPPLQEWFDPISEEGLDWQVRHYETSVIALFEPLTRRSSRLPNHRR